jgi:anthranilate phosphoribosyltransferase
MNPFSEFSGNQEVLAELLKKKGTGPKANKVLPEAVIQNLNTLLLDPQILPITRAAFLTALYMLQAGPLESDWLRNFLSSATLLDDPLLKLLRNPKPDPLEFKIAKVLDFRDLNYQEAREVAEAGFSGSLHPILFAAFLEGQRLKGETHQENMAFFEVMWNQAQRVQTNLPLIIDLADSYDGCNRTRSYTPFIAALLGSCGYPTICHSPINMGPKWGVTSEQILRACHKKTQRSLKQTEDELLRTDIQWSFATQEVFNPGLMAFKQLRTEMVKRPFISTFEKLLQPLRAINGNHIVVGYTHTPYRDKVAKILLEDPQTPAAIIMRGTEGSTQISMNKSTLFSCVKANSISQGQVEPTEFGLESLNITPDKSLTAQDSAEAGLGALRGEKGPAREHMLYFCSFILDQFELESKPNAMVKLKHSLDAGIALSHFEKGCV